MLFKRNFFLFILRRREKSDVFLVVHKQKVVGVNNFLHHLDKFFKIIKTNICSETSLYSSSTFMT